MRLRTDEAPALEHALVVLEREEIIAEKDAKIRELEALLAAERDRPQHEREQRIALEEQHGIATRQLEELRKSYAILQQEHELLRRRIFEAKAERVDSKQLELELEKTKAELDRVRSEIETVTGTIARRGGAAS